MGSVSSAALRGVTPDLPGRPLHVPSRDAPAAASRARPKCPSQAWPGAHRALLSGDTDPWPGPASPSSRSWESGGPRPGREQTGTGATEGGLRLLRETPGELVSTEKEIAAEGPNAGVCATRRAWAGVRGTTVYGPPARGPPKPLRPASVTELAWGSQPSDRCLHR